MFCPICGAKIPDTAKFCGKCGNKIEAVGADAAAGGSYGAAQAAAQPPRQTPAQPQRPQQSEPHTNLPTVRPTQRVQTVQPAYVQTQQVVKPRRRLPLKLIGGIAAAVCVLAAGAFAAVKLLAPSDPYVVLADGEYQVFTGLKDPEPVEIASYKSDDDAFSSLVQFTEDGKYVYYITKHDGSYGTLNRAEWKKLKKDSSKNDKYIETIASNVFEGSLELFDDGTACYRNNDNTLFYYDGSEPVRIAKNVTGFLADEDKRIVYRTEKNDNGEFALCGVSLKDPEKIIKFDSGISRWLHGDDFDNGVVYTKWSRDGDREDVYIAGFDHEIEKVLTNCQHSALIGTGEDQKLVIETKSKATFDIKDYATGGNDLFGDSSFLDLMQWGIFGGNMELHDIYIFNDKAGEFELAAQNALTVSYPDMDNVVYYVSQDSLGKLDLSDCTEIEDTAVAAKEWLKNGVCLMAVYDDEWQKLTFSEQALETLQETEWTNMYAGKDSLYLEADDGLYIAAIKSGTIGDFSVLSDDGHLENADGDVVYYSENIYSTDNGECGDIYQHDGKGKELVIRDARWVEIYNDGSKVVRDSDAEISIINQKEDTTLLGDLEDVNLDCIINISDSRYLYVADGDAYYYNGKESEMIVPDVDFLWAAAEEAVSVYVD